MTRNFPLLRNFLAAFVVALSFAPQLAAPARAKATVASAQIADHLAGKDEPRKPKPKPGPKGEGEGDS